MEERVVLRYRDGRTERAMLEPIDSTRELLTVRRDEGGTDEVAFSALKAVFFPRTVAEEELEPAAGMVPLGAR